MTFTYCKEYEQELSEENDILVSDLSDIQVECASICDICKSARKDVVYIPCGHMSCHECRDSLVEIMDVNLTSALNCHTCRRPVTLIRAVNHWDASMEKLVLLFELLQF